MFQVIVRMTVQNAVPSANWGSLMHGMLMEHLKGGWPSILHEDLSRPLSQWIDPISSNQLDWHLQFLDDRLAVCFLECCQQGDEWYCQHNGSRMTVENFHVRQESLQDYISRKMDEDRPVSDLTIYFKTPTTHKSQGKTVLFPSVELISNSLRNKLCEVDETISLPDDHLQLFTKATRIHQYDLKSALFGLEGSWIMGYTGQITLRITGPEHMIRFGNMLLGLAPWFGIGIKTTLGMGGCLVSHQ